MPEHTRDKPCRAARAWPLGHALAALLGVVPLAPGVPVQAEVSPLLQSPDVHLGFDGALKVGVPLPLDVSVPPLPGAGPADVIVDAPALGPQAGTVVTSTVTLFQAVPNTERAFHAPVVVNDLRRPLTIRVRLSGREVMRRAIPIDPARVGGRLVVVLSRARAGLESLRTLPGRVVVSYVSGRTLPRLWQEYAAVDLLVIRDPDLQEMDQAQREALVTWVRLGGRLLVIPRGDPSVPPFLQALLPAGVGQARPVSLAPLAARYGGRLPPGPYAVATLRPRPGAEDVRAGGVSVIVSAAAGWGRVTVWAFDPWDPAFLEWSGRLGLWAETLGSPSRPQGAVERLASQFPERTPLDPRVYIVVGAAIFLYVAGAFFLPRGQSPLIRAGVGLLIACVGIAAFAALAQGVRARSVTLTQVTFLAHAPGTAVAQVTAVARVAVPYGGRYRLSAGPGFFAGPVDPSGDVEVTLGSQEILLAGRLSPEAPTRVFHALGAIPLAVQGVLESEDQRLTVDLGSDRLRHAELWWRDRVYVLGDVPPGTSSRSLHPEQWMPVSDANTEGRVRESIFRAWEGDGIMIHTTPVLMGELERALPAFALQGAGTSGQRLTVLLVPLARR